MNPNTGSRGMPDMPDMRESPDRHGGHDLAIDVRGLDKHFGDKHVVKNVSLQVRRGEIFGFLGAPRAAYVGVRGRF